MKSFHSIYDKELLGFSKTYDMVLCIYFGRIMDLILRNFNAEYLTDEVLPCLRFSTGIMSLDKRKLAKC